MEIALPHVINQTLAPLQRSPAERVLERYEITATLMHHVPDRDIVFQWPLKVSVERTIRLHDIWAYLQSTLYILPQRCGESIMQIRKMCGTEHHSQSSKT